METAKFVSMFDKFFDCLNVRDFTTGKHHRKSFQDPYRSSTDFRLKVHIILPLIDCVHMYYVVARGRVYSIFRSVGGKCSA